LNLKPSPPLGDPAPPAYESLLEEAAGLVRIESDFWDIWGRQHHTSVATARAILGSLGFRTGTIKELQESIDDFRLRRWSRPLAPVTVLRESAPEFSVALRIPAWLPMTAKVSALLRLENGTSAQTDSLTGALKEVRTQAIGGGHYRELCLPLPGTRVCGYHSLEVIVAAEGVPILRGTQRVIVAPDRAWTPKELGPGHCVAGLAVSLFGLRSQRNWGAGDFTDLRMLLDWAANDLGVAFVALNPLHAIANRQPFNTSPYLPESLYFRNYLYLDVEALQEYADCPWAQALVARPAFQRCLQALRNSEFIEYEAVARLKRAVLRLLYRNFRRALGENTPRAREFGAWCAQEGKLLEQFATYSAIYEALHKEDRNIWIWPDWPACYRDAESEEVRKFAKEHPRSVQFHQFVQWQIDQQIEGVQACAKGLGMPIGLYHDLALATDRCGSDLWAHRKHFVDGCRVGSPPDDFAPDGQDWAFPPPNGEAHRESGYQLFIETIRRNSRHGGALRIDHVMRFFRLFWIPDGMTAREGTYVRDYSEDLLGILALESERNQFIVVGEDLGTVPPEVRDALERNGVFSYRLFYFEKAPDGNLKRSSDYTRQALVSSTTHDLPTLAGFWAGRDIEARRAAGILPNDDLYHRQKEERWGEKLRMVEALIREGFLRADFPREACTWSELTGELHNAVIGFLVSTPSQLMLLNQEDLTKELDQQNLPGTTGEYPNWRRKMRLAVEDLRTQSAARDFTLMFRNWLVRTNRLTAPHPTART
jgi:4-alpha-glucanotransferase